MIDWYVEVSDHLKSDSYLKTVIETATPFMNYFCDRLSDVKDFKLQDMERLFGEIIEEMPIMNYRVHNGEFIIQYNDSTHIKLTDTTKQIYRDIKLEKIIFN